VERGVFNVLVKLVQYVLEQLTVTLHFAMPCR
jgi:hypothetical protein